MSDRFQKIGNVKYKIIKCGSFHSDGGAAFGVLPHAFWKKSYPFDELNRVKMDINLLYLEVENYKILIDTGYGSKLTDKEKKIYKTEEVEISEVLKENGILPESINYVILTHLHFDHSGGITSFNNENEILNFPNATHLVQKKEWKIAKNPDILNRAAYNFKKNLSFLEENGDYKLIEGDYQLNDNVKILLTEGHSEGMQSVYIESGNMAACYAGDIIPSKPHINLPVTSAYDISRKKTFKAKKRILNLLKEKKGFLFLNHDINISKVNIEK